MSVLQAVILGLVQGLAEFLPISSSGHLFLAKQYFGLGDVPILFDLFLHVATLGAVLVVFRSVLYRLMGVAYRFVLRKSQPSDKEDLGYIALMLVATVITAVIGFSLKDLELSSKLVYAGFIYTALLLILSTKISTLPQMQSQSLMSKGTKGHFLLAILVGTFQGLAVLPGISRSGSTIGYALLGGVSRERAGEMSFLLSIPAILGGFILTLRDVEGANVLQQLDLLPLLLSFAVAFASGYVALRFLLKLVKQLKLHYFAYYLIPLGLLGLSGLLP
jgi:undecaprenyl-diphosphatase